MFQIMMRTEFEFIDFLHSRFDLRKIGDDCAVLDFGLEKDLVITADLLIEEVDFILEWTSAEQLGHKALAVSLSDIAAMGAMPRYGLVSLGINQTLWGSEFLDRFYEGWFNLAKEFSVELVGGDISKSEKFLVDSIVIGEIEKGKAIKRDKAKEGDRVFVTGFLGDAAAGLKLLRDGNREFKTLVLRYLKPMPRVKVGRFLSQNSIANAMIDISDGLSSDLWHICKASGVGARIFVSSIPLSSDLCRAFESSEEQLELALHGGEDFELLFTVSPEKMDRLADYFLDVQITCIGEIIKGSHVEIVFSDRTEILEPKGFRHF